MALTRDPDALVGVLFEGELLLGVLREEVVDVLVVDLQVRGVDEVLRVLKTQNLSLFLLTKYFLSHMVRCRSHFEK